MLIITGTSGASLSRSNTRSSALSVRKCIRNAGLIHNSANLIALKREIRYVVENRSLNFRFT